MSWKLRHESWPVSTRPDCNNDIRPITCSQLTVSFACLHTYTFWINVNEDDRFDCRNRIDWLNVDWMLLHWSFLHRFQNTRSCREFQFFFLHLSLSSNETRFYKHVAVNFRYIGLDGQLKLDSIINYIRHHWTLNDSRSALPAQLLQLKHSHLCWRNKNARNDPVQFR